jgi:hypothetical protein
MGNKNILWLQSAIEQFLINHVTMQVQSRHDCKTGNFIHVEIDDMSQGAIDIRWYHQRDPFETDSRISGRATFSVPKALRMFMVSNEEEHQCDRKSR